MGSSGGSGSSSDGDSTVWTRYATYIETAQRDVLSYAATAMADIYGNSPYSSYIWTNYDDAIYGIGKTLRDFASVHEYYKLFIGDINVEDLFEEVAAKIVDTDTIRDLTSSQSDLLDDDLEQKIIPRFNAGMRDINSVMSSTFIVGRAVIEQSKIKSLADYSAKLQYNLISIAVNVLNEHLRWNKDAYMAYTDILKIAATVKMDETRINYEMETKDILWPFTVLKLRMGLIGALQGAMNQVSHNDSEVKALPSMGGAVGGAMTGAAAGLMLAGPLGGLVGGAAGLLGGLL